MNFKKTLTTHQKLMADVGALLRTIDKAEELEVPEISQYLNNYRDFTDKVASMLKKMSSDEANNEDKVNLILEELSGLKEVVPEIYDGLTSMANSLKDENIEQFKKPGKENANYDVRNGENVYNAAEEKNAFALSVLRR